MKKSLGANMQFIGEIVDVKAEDSVLGDKNIPQMQKIDQFLFCPGTRTYYKVGDYIGKAFSIGRQFAK